MAVRAIYRDEYAQKKFSYKGRRYHHIEHARWSALWDNLRLEFNYLPRKHEVVAPGPGTYMRGKDDDTLFYSPHFYVHGLDVFVDIKREDPKAESVSAACDLFRTTGIPVLIFRGPMFQPNWTTYSPPATLCRECASPQSHYLQFDGRHFRIGPSMNENDVIHPRLRDAFSEALQI